MTQERPERDPPEPPAIPAGGLPAPESSSHAPAALQTLKQAMRRARFDDAERVGVIADLRAARIGRLELLEEALQPLEAQIPEDVDLFDFGMMPGANPRLFVDMIGFVEMGRDARTYRLLQDTRHGRTLLAESDSIERMVEIVTDYVARRLLERDKALAADAESLAAPSSSPARKTRPASSVPDRAAASRAMPPPRGRTTRIAGAAFAVLIDLLGAIAFFGILFWLGWIVWTRIYGQA